MHFISKMRVAIFILNSGISYHIYIYCISSNFVYNYRNRMTSGQLNSHLYAKILAIIRHQNCQKTNEGHIKTNFWSFNTSLKSINNIHDVTRKNHQQSKPQPKYLKPKTKKTVKSNIRCKSAVLQFVRPATCDVQPRKTHIKNTITQQSCNSDINLLEMVKNETLAKLSIQKQELMRNIFESKKMQIHGIDEDQETMSKQNAINFKTYKALNKMMNIQDKIYQTVHCFPKNGNSYNRR